MLMELQETAWKITPLTTLQWQQYNHLAALAAAGFTNPYVLHIHTFTVARWGFFFIKVGHSPTCCCSWVFVPRFKEAVRVD